MEGTVLLEKIIQVSYGIHRGAAGRDEEHRAYKHESQVIRDFAVKCPALFNAPNGIERVFNVGKYFND